MGLSLSGGLRRGELNGQLPEQVGVISRDGPVLQVQFLNQKTCGGSYGWISCRECLEYDTKMVSSLKNLLPFIYGKRHG